MSSPSPHLEPLLKKAAEMKAQNCSWVKIGDKLHRSPETCRRWPQLYPETWRRYYREAEEQLSMTSGSAATAVQQSLLFSDNPRIRLEASKALDRKRDKEIDRQVRTKQAQTDPVQPLIFQYVTLLKSMSHDEIKKHLAELVARHPPGAGSNDPGGLVPPGTAQPG